jgi:signal transduction histidine kinase
MNSGAPESINMKKRRAKLLSGILILTFLNVHWSLTNGQQMQRIDSMERLLDSIGPEHKAEILKELAWAYHSINPEKGIRYGLEGLNLSRTLKLKKGESEVLMNIGICNYTLNHYEQAISYFLQSLKIKEELNDKNGIAAIYNNLGNIYRDMGNNAAARESYQKTFEISTKTLNRRVAATALSNLAIICRQEQDFNKALEYNFQALELRKEVDDQRGISASLDNLAVIYADSANPGRNLKKALDFVHQALYIKAKMGDLYGMSQALINIGQMNVELCSFHEADRYFGQALQTAREIKATSVEIACYHHMSNLYALQGNYRKALDYHLRYSKLNDSLFTIESSRKIAEMQVKYETGKKEQENELLKKESNIQLLQINRQRNLRNFFILLGIMILGLAVAMYSLYLIKRKANRQLEEKNRQLAVLNATKDRFFSIIAHDLKNPFGTLLSVSSHLNDRFHEIDNDQKMRIIKLIHNSAACTHDLVENLLEWSVSQTGSVPLVPESIKLRSIVIDCIDLMRLNADKKKLSLNMEIPDDVVVKADRNMLSTVLRNLLTNAIKFSTKPGMITIRSLVSGTMIEVLIKDEGVGMNSEQLERLFRIDVTPPDSGIPGEKGTGLGLILCREFIEKNGGEIRAVSEPGKGSTFIFTLPHG